MKSINYFLIVVMFIIINTSIYSQGKVITKDEANNLFGPVTHSVNMNRGNLVSLLQKSSGQIMLKFINNELNLLDNKRNPIFSSSTVSPAADVVFHVYGISVVKELLGKGEDDNIYFEQRESVLTVTNGNYTMEYAQFCPPFCKDE